MYWIPANARTTREAAGLSDINCLISLDKHLITIRDRQEPYHDCSWPIMLSNGGEGVKTRECRNLLPARRSPA